MYDLEILHKCGKRVETKSQKVFGASFDIYKSYRGKTGSEAVVFVLFFYVKFCFTFILFH